MTNRFKQLDLVDRVPEELWTEICNTVKEAGTKIIPKKKKCKKAKWLSEEALQTAQALEVLPVRTMNYRMQDLSSDWCTK